MMMAPILKPHYSLAHPESVSDAMLWLLFVDAGYSIA